MRIAVFGANGPTGRLLTGRALAAGHQVTAVTRQPHAFPLHHERLAVVGTDVLDPTAVDAAMTDQEAVLSTLGVPAGKEPINTYSRGTANIIAAMERHRVRRLAVVSSSGVDPQPRLRHHRLTSPPRDTLPPARLVILRPRRLARQGVG